MMPPEDRLRQLQEGFQRFPGRAPQGSGETGLHALSAATMNPQTMQPYQDMLDEREEFLNLQREMAGKAPMGARFGGEIGQTPLPSTLFNPDTLGNGTPQTSSVPVAPPLQGLQQAAGRRRR